ncbi:MAG: class I SAM-dependent methyltransferase [Actinomycetota bacterium]
MNKIMKQEWDSIADENAFYGVLSRDEFENPDEIDIDKFWETGKNDVNTILEIVRPENSKSLKMLEIGCGLGRMTHHFAECFGEVYALDVSSEMLSKAENYWKHLPNVNWVLGNGEDLSTIADAGVDCVFSFWVLQHIPDREAVINYIRESARVLKEGGTAFLQFRMAPNALNFAALKYNVVRMMPTPLHNSLRTLWDRINKYDGTRAKFARQYESWRGCIMTPAIIETVSAKCGLQIQKQGSFGIQSSGTQSAYYVFRKQPETSNIAKG